MPPAMPVVADSLIAKFCSLIKVDSLKISLSSLSLCIAFFHQFAPICIPGGAKSEQVEQGTVPPELWQTIGGKLKNLKQSYFSSKLPG
jgi:hypothetical protein